MNEILYNGEGTFATATPMQAHVTTSSASTSTTLLEIPPGPICVSNTGTLVGCPKQKEKTAMDPWSAFAFVEICVGIAILMGMTLIAMGEFNDRRVKRKDRKHERKLERQRVKQAANHEGDHD